MHRRRGTWRAWGAAIALMFLAPLCVAQVRAKAKAARDPCQARDRCLRLYQLGKAGSVAALDEAFHAGCDGYPEEAIRALRLYQLGAPGGAQALLNSMPRGIGDFMSLLWMTGSGGFETVGDFEFFYGTVRPMDELPRKGCHDTGPAGNKGEFRTYFATVAGLSVSHPRYLPGFFLASQLFGYKADWDSLNEGHGYTPVEVDPMFSRLLAFQLKTRPKTFLWYARWNRFGGAALRQAEAALAAEKHKTAPERPRKGVSHRGGRAICSGSKAGAERPRNSTAPQALWQSRRPAPRQATRRGPQSRGPQRAAARVGAGSRAGTRAKQ